MSSKKLITATCMVITTAVMATSAFAMAPFGRAIFYFSENGGLVGEQVLTCKPDGWNAGNIHTAYYVETEVDCAVPTPKPNMRGPSPVCTPGLKGCTCEGYSPDQYTCTSLPPPPQPPYDSNWYPCSIGYPPPSCLELDGDFVSADGIGNADVGSAAVGGGGGGSSNIVAGSYVIEYVLPASITIQEACREIEQCSMMPEPITKMGWTWLPYW